MSLGQAEEVKASVPLAAETVAAAVAEPAEPDLPQRVADIEAYINNTAENFIRSAMAPTMSAGVIIAKVSWNMAHMLSLIQW